LLARQPVVGQQSAAALKKCTPILEGPARPCADRSAPTCRGPISPGSPKQPSACPGRISRPGTISRWRTCQRRRELHGRQLCPERQGPSHNCSLLGTCVAPTVAGVLSGQALAALIVQGNKELGFSADPVAKRPGRVELDQRRTSPRETPQRSYR
jgi:hypothetical protein